ncbi:peroxiredoxin [Mycobacterium sp. OTB74]|jgi:peroxiredoxin (alkyl hydroperoxide reductase subunit C)|uniref:peroxiredoxin n=1 Tax=Mycobacterium sp. OTB74 TaxID=1853452 RepID=UPI00247332FE|nr:peroxiredoxin [Mycobacterium sp. OTB74]MDH6246052.1 peroxiredoxin [Mycobacterium sp. OTB74]
MIPVGAPAPDFTLKDQHGRPVTMSALRGCNVLVVFFPLAFTPVCAGELGEIQDHLATYRNSSVETLTISVGPPATHKVWARESGFDFPILSDFWPHGAVSQAYGVFNADAGYPDRGTFVVDRTGVVRFAECTSPGEQRDQSVWVSALAALN